MNRKLRRTSRKRQKEHLKEMKLPTVLTRLPKEEWKGKEIPGRIEIWISRDFMVQIFEEKDNIKRLSVNRTSYDGKTGWSENISWEDLQKIKRAVGFAGHDAVEVYPDDYDVVNIANLRHLWVFPLHSKLDFIWRKAAS